MIQWSHSRLQTFKVCPKQFHHVYVLKDVVDDGPKHPTTVWGEQVHKALELFIKDSQPLPANMTQYQPVADAMLSLPNVLSEQRLAIKVDWTPTEFFAPDVWGRCIIDVLSIDGDEAYVADFKLGKYRGDTGQAAVNATFTLCNYPQVQRVTTQFLYLTAGKVDTQSFDRANLSEYAEPTLEVLRQIETCQSNGAWHATPSGLCGYCPVKRCQFNRNRS